MQKISPGPLFVRFPMFLMFSLKSVLVLFFVLGSCCHCFFVVLFCIARFGKVFTRPWSVLGPFFGSLSSPGSSEAAPCLVAVCPAAAAEARANSDSKAYLHLLIAQPLRKIFIAPRPSFNKARCHASAPQRFSDRTRRALRHREKTA